MTKLRMLIALTLALSALLLPACRANQDDPIEVQRRFVETINDDIKRAEPGLKKPVAAKFKTDDRHVTYFTEYTGKLSYDIKKTDSIITPFLGTVSWSMRWFSKGDLFGSEFDDEMPMTLIANYGYQDGQWVIKDLSRDMGNGKRVSAEEYLILFQKEDKK